MKPGMLRAWSLGAVILVAVFSIWFVFLHIEVFSQTAFVILWVSPMVAAFVTSYMSPSHKILLGTSLALPFALLAVTLNSVGQFFGASVDFPSLKGGLIFYVLALISSAVISIPGSVAGYALTRKG